MKSPFHNIFKIWVNDLVGTILPSICNLPFFVDTLRARIRERSHITSSAKGGGGFQKMTGGGGGFMVR